MSNNLNVKFDFPTQGDTTLNDIFQNNSKDIVNPLLPFGININGSISICYDKCGQEFENTEIDVTIMRNYGKMLMLKPKDDASNTSTLSIVLDSRNDNTDDNGKGTYKLKYICFTCPPTIKIGTDDSDIQSYLIYSNDQGLYSVVCTLYNSSTAEIDALPNALINSLLTSNNIPDIGKSNGNLSIRNIDITHFFPEKKDYFEYINHDNNNTKKSVLVKVFQKKVKISPNVMDTLKQKLFNPKSNDNYTNFKNTLSLLYNNKPKKIDIFSVAHIDIPVNNNTENNQSDTFKNEDNKKNDDETREETE